MGAGMGSVDDECWVDVFSLRCRGRVLRPARLYLLLDGRRVLLHSLEHGQGVELQRFRRFPAEGVTPTCSASICDDERMLALDENRSLPCESATSVHGRLCKGNFSHSNFAVNIRRRKNLTEELVDSLSFLVLKKSTMMLKNWSDLAEMTDCVNYIDYRRILYSIAGDQVSMIPRNYRLARLSLAELRHSRDAILPSTIISVSSWSIKSGNLTEECPILNLTTFSLRTPPPILDRRERLTFLELDAFQLAGRRPHTKACIVLLRQVPVVHFEDGRKYVIYS